MQPAARGLGDKALAVFAFAAYHQLESGQTVTSVVQRDRAGHRADDEAISELQERGFVRADGEDVRFTEEGESVLRTIIEGLRRAVESG